MVAHSNKVPPCTPNAETFASFAVFSFNVVEIPHMTVASSPHTHWMEGCTFAYTIIPILGQRKRTVYEVSNITECANDPKWGKTSHTPHDCGRLLCMLSISCYKV